MGNVKKWNEILRSERESRNWTQAKVANALRTDPKRVSEWEVGKTKPGYKYRRMLMKLFGKSAEEFGFLTHEFDDEVLDENSHQETNAKAADTLPQENETTPIHILIPKDISHVTIHIQQQPPIRPGIFITGDIIDRETSRTSEESTESDIENMDPGRRKAIKLITTAGIALMGSQIAGPEQWEYLERLAGGLKKPSRIDTKTINGLRDTTASYWQLRVNGTTTSPDLLQAAKNHYHIVAQLLEGSLLPTVRISLSVAASETALLAGMVLATDLHKHDEAQSYYNLALEIVQQANNDSLYAAVLGRMGALAAAAEKPQAAYALLQEAQHAPIQSDMFTLHAWLAAEEAEVQADLAVQENRQNISLCFKALERAEMLASQIRSEENTFGMYFDSLRIPAYLGSCNLRLHHPNEALEALKVALKPLEPSGALTRAVLLDLAEASIQANAIDQACRHLEQALEIVTQTQTTSSLQRVFELRRQLKPWSTMQDVKDLDEQLRPFTTRGGKS